MVDRSGEGELPAVSSSPGPKVSLRSLVTADLMAGDCPRRHAARRAAMAADPSRAGRIMRLATRLHHQMDAMTIEAAGANGSAHGSPRMNVRHLGDQLYGLARAWHCHAGIYRTKAADALLTGGRLAVGGDAVVHCEHTIPASLMVRMLWHARRAGDLPTPPDTLRWLITNSVVTVALQSERKAKGDEPVALGRRRAIGSRESAWSNDHPDLPEGTTTLDMVRPFRRYEGTGAEILHVSHGGVDLCSTMADHRARIANCPLHGLRMS
jgi:hypothetical protein